MFTILCIWGGPVAVVCGAAGGLVGAIIGGILAIVLSTWYEASCGAYDKGVILRGTLMHRWLDRSPLLYSFWAGWGLTPTCVR